MGKIPWRRKWLPTPVFLPGIYHGQRNLVGYTVCGGCKESDTIDYMGACTHTHTHTHTHAHTHSIMGKRRGNEVKLETKARL